MIVYFPDAYEDELAYSLFARYHVHTGNLSFRATAEDLFQNKDAIPSPEFIVPLTDETYKIITRELPFDDFISRHTMLPYYIRFLPLERRQRAVDLIREMDRTFYDALYMRRCKTERRQHMRYCPMCAASDRMKYGETYWHRKHQLTGVDICLEHRCRLEDSTTGIAADTQRFMLIHGETVIPNDTEPDRSISDLECKVAAYVLQVFNADMDLRNDVAAGKFLQSRLEGTPYTSIRGEQVFARKLFTDLTDHYRELPQNTLEQWWYVQKVFCSQNFHTYDICLIALFLGIEIEDLLDPVLPEQTLQQRFDSRLRLLRSQGMTQKQAAEVMGVSIHAVKNVEEKRYRSAQSMTL